MIRVPCVVFLVALTLVKVVGAAHYADDDRVKAFALNHNTNAALETQTVSLPVDPKNPSGDKYICNFEYATVANKAPAPAPAAEQLPPQQLLQELDGRCVIGREEYWEYKVCFGHGGEITQTHGAEIFRLGTFQDFGGDKGEIITYGKGDPCMPSAAHRTSTVKFVCNEDAGLHFIQVLESRTCVYNFLIKWDGVCGHNDFLQEIATIRTKQPTKEPWYLDLRRNVDNSLVCSVRHTALLTDVRPYKFERFMLSVKNTAEDDIVNHVDDSVALIRHSNRRSFDSREYLTTLSTIWSTPEFDGDVEFAQLHLKMKAKQ
eukprot:GFYU01013506.1.p1 GENE.GFYU01013506.1~~GFYU01013506.1.p1  ORF type:complete len:317 (+),score=65.59 GFYU01013506.1:42-992(+)